MWTSQVYGHNDKMARTKTHRTILGIFSQNANSTRFLDEVLDIAKRIQKVQCNYKSSTQATHVVI